jgi:hypothetical protein
MDLVGSDAMQDEESMRRMWSESMKACNCSTARITYDDFLLIMKGQSKDSDDMDGVSQDDSALEQSGTNGKKPVREEGGTPTSSKLINSPLLPPIPTVPDIEAPLSMDDDDDLPCTFPIIPSHLNAPMTPRRSAPDFLALRSDLKYVPEDAVEVEINGSNPELLKVTLTPSIPRPKLVARQKSRSMDESEMKKRMLLPAANGPNGHTAAAMPQADPELRDTLINKKNIAVLQANRKLYRAHRQMRLAVIEASTRFEEQQARHARDILIAQEEEKNPSGGKGSAGLVMRRVQNKTIPSEAIASLLARNRKEQQDLMEKASLLGGRGTRTRKKTVSDIGGMMGSLTQEEMTNISLQASGAMPAAIPPIIETKPMADDDADTNLRGATIPGEFRLVNDPFGLHGKYSAMVGDLSAMVRDIVG